MANWSHPKELKIYLNEIEENEQATAGRYLRVERLHLSICLIIYPKYQNELGCWLDERKFPILSNCILGPFPNNRIEF
jgi:hypothetical protein